jgi:hypothetical protein
MGIPIWEIRNLNHRNSAQRSLLVSVDLSSDEIFATGDRLSFAHNLNRRNSAQRSLLVSVDLSSDETSATGSRQCFVP